MSNYYITEVTECAECGGHGYVMTDYYVTNDMIATPCPKKCNNGQLETHIPLLDVLKRLRWTQYSPTMYDGEGGQADREFENLRIEDETTNL